MSTIKDLLDVELCKSASDYHTDLQWSKQLAEEARNAIPASPKVPAISRIAPATRYTPEQYASMMPKVKPTLLGNIGSKARQFGRAANRVASYDLNKSPVMDGLRSGAKSISNAAKPAIGYAAKLAGPAIMGGALLDSGRRFGVAAGNDLNNVASRFPGMNGQTITQAWGGTPDKGGILSPIADKFVNRRRQ